MSIAYGDRQTAGFPGIVTAIENAEWAFAGTRGGNIPASGQDVFVSFSVWTALLAHGATEALDGVTVFIQEDERIFYENNSLRALAEQAYHQPHFALFNSALLRDHFRTEGRANLPRRRGGRRRPRPVMLMP